MPGASPRAPIVNKNISPKPEALPTRRLAAAPENSAGVEVLGDALMVIDVAASEEVASSEDVVALDDDEAILDVDAGAKVELGSGVASTVGVSDCVSRATLIEALIDSAAELAAPTSDAVSEKVV